MNYSKSSTQARQPGPGKVPWTCHQCGRPAYPGWVVALRTSPIRWEVVCDGCDEGDGLSFYDFATERAATWPELAEWCAHLSGKRWLAESNWSELLNALGGYSRRA